VNLAVYAGIAVKLGISIVRSAVLRRRALAAGRGALDSPSGTRPSES
jgi:hypothetical protein